MTSKDAEYDCMPGEAQKARAGKKSVPDKASGICPLNAICERGVQTEFPEVKTDRAEVRMRRVRRGEFLFSAGEKFHGVYVLRVGAFKNIAILSDKESQVVDFRLPGDVLGMSALDSGRYPFSALALEPSEVCELRINTSQKLCLHPDLVSTMSRQLQRIQWASVLLRTQNAEQRVIHFLLHVGGHQQESNDRIVDMKLPMSRKDIANYLGIAVETVSRTLHSLQADGLLTTSGRNMQLLDCPSMTERLQGTEPVHYS